MGAATARRSTIITLGIIPSVYLGVVLDVVYGLIDPSLFGLWKFDLPATTFGFFSVEVCGAQERK